MEHGCTYCGCDVRDHEPLFVRERRDGNRVDAGRFCNYACLAAHIEDEGLVVDATCRFDP